VADGQLQRGQTGATRRASSSVIIFQWSQVIVWTFFLCY